MPRAYVLNAGRTVQLTRRTSFSSAHLYSQKRFTQQENLEHFGACFTPYGHGHNYTFEAYFEGKIDAITGLVVNLADVEKVLKGVTAPLDHQHLNFVVPYFKELIPTTENILLYLHRQLKQECDRLSLNLVKSRLFELEDLWVEFTEPAFETLSNTPSQVTRKYEISALHNLLNPDISDEENMRLYGMCYRLHGHNYQVFVTLDSTINETTGLVYSRSEIDEIVTRHLVTPLTGKNLNNIFGNTSGESLCCAFYDLLAPHFRPETLLAVGMQETRKNWFEHTRRHANLK